MAHGAGNSEDLPAKMAARREAEKSAVEQSEVAAANAEAVKEISLNPDMKQVTGEAEKRLRGAREKITAMENGELPEFIADAIKEKEVIKDNGVLSQIASIPYGSFAAAYIAGLHEKLAWKLTHMKKPTSYIDVAFDRYRGTVTNITAKPWERMAALKAANELYEDYSKKIGQPPVAPKPAKTAPGEAPNMREFADEVTQDDTASHQNALAYIDRQLASLAADFPKVNPGALKTYKYQINDIADDTDAVTQRLVVLANFGTAFGEIARAALENQDASETPHGNAAIRQSESAATGNGEGAAEKEKTAPALTDAQRVQIMKNYIDSGELKDKVTAGGFEKVFKASLDNPEKAVAAIKAKQKEWGLKGAHIDGILGPETYQAALASTNTGEQYAVLFRGETKEAAAVAVSAVEVPKQKVAEVKEPEIDSIKRLPAVKNINTPEANELVAMREDWEGESAGSTLRVIRFEKDKKTIYGEKPDGTIVANIGINRLRVPNDREIDFHRLGQYEHVVALARAEQKREAEVLAKLIRKGKLTDDLSMPNGDRLVAGTDITYREYPTKFVVLTKTKTYDLPKSTFAMLPVKDKHYESQERFARVKGGVLIEAVGAKTGVRQEIAKTRADETVAVISETDKGEYLVRTADGKEGLVPKAALEEGTLAQRKPNEKPSEAVARVYRETHQQKKGGPPVELPAVATEAVPGIAVASASPTAAPEKTT